MKKVFTTFLFVLANVLAFQVTILIFGRVFLHASYEKFSDYNIMYLTFLTLVSSSLAYFLENKVGNTKKSKLLQRIRWIAGLFLSLIPIIVIIPLFNSPLLDDRFAPGYRGVLIYAIPAFIYFGYRIIKDSR